MLTLEQADRFHDALAQQALVLTPNHQLAVALHETWGAYLRKQSRPTVCSTPEILAIDMWVRNKWQSFVVSAGHNKAHWQVLSSNQEQLIWQGIISDSQDSYTLLNPRDCARAATQAATLMKQYFLSTNAVSNWLEHNWPTPEERLDLSGFLGWYEKYEAIKQDRKLLSLSDLVAIITELASKQKITIPGSVVTFGFTEPPPLYQSLLDKLTENTNSLNLRLEHLSPQLSVWQCSNQQHEIQAAAEWSDKILKAKADNKALKDVKIGILCPDLTARQQDIARAFSHYETLENTAGRIRDTANQQLFISSTLELLILNRPLLNTLQVCRLLRMPLIAGAKAEESARADLELQLRNYAEYDITPAQLRFFCNQENRTHYCPDLAQRLQYFSEIARSVANKKISPARCLQVFRQQLSGLGWPGDGELTPAEVYALEIWEKLQDQFLSVAAFRTSLTLTEAVKYLEDLADNLHFSSQQITDRVSILSVEEAEHFQFTHLWIMGVNEHLWPGDSPLNPLLPLTLQREHGFPKTDKNRLYQFYEALLGTLAGNASEETRISYSILQDELEARPSPALDQFSLPPGIYPGNNTAQFSPAVSRLRGSAETEILLSSASLPLHENEQPGGGKTLLQNQSQCPFRSFAIHRLNAAELTTPTYGLNPMVLGNLLHSVLERVWSTLGTYQSLKVMSQEDRKQLARQCSSQAVDRLSRKHPQLMKNRFRKLEEERLTEMVVEWLKTELERDFDEVADIEQEFSWTYKTLSLSLKVDRLDRNRQQKLEVIDYKSGRPLSMVWNDERPQQPQLMLYLLAVEEKYGKDTVSALLHAYVSAGNFSFQYIDLGQTGSIPAKSRPGALYDWSEIKSLWQHALETLADEFISGLHSVTPRNTGFCQTCHVKSLCRIQLNSTSLADSPDVPDNSEYAQV